MGARVKVEFTGGGPLDGRSEDLEEPLDPFIEHTNSMTVQAGYQWPVTYIYRLLPAESPPTSRPFWRLPERQVRKYEFLGEGRRPSGGSPVAAGS